ncbi:MAG TPA: hypothetical protein VIY48_13955 [Candidatus Paceibacterota bacterium]
MGMFLKIRIVGMAIPLMVSLSAHAKEVKVFRFSFEIPDAWYVDGGNGESRLYASGAKEMYQPPLVMAEACTSTKDIDCEKEADDPFPYNRVTQKESYQENYKYLGCTGSTITTIARDGNVVERRLWCKKAGFSLFVTKNAALSVTYLPPDQSADINEFLDAIASTLKVR